MLDLAGRFIWRGHIGQRRNPPLAIGGLQHLTKRDDLAMQSRAGGFLRLAGLRIDPGRLAVKPVFLHLASRDVFKGRIAKERQEVDADEIGLRLHISGIAFA